MRHSFPRGVVPRPLPVDGEGIQVALERAALGELKHGVHMRRRGVANLGQHIRNMGMQLASLVQSAQHAELAVACVSHVLILGALEVVEALGGHELATRCRPAAQDRREGASRNWPEHRITQGYQRARRVGGRRRNLLAAACCRRIRLELVLQLLLGDCGSCHTGNTATFWRAARRRGRTQRWLRRF